MPEKSVIDLEALLAPIPGENPSGVEVRYTRYDEIKKAREEDDNLSKGDWEQKGPKKVADWKKVISIATKALTSETKDLQVAAWLLEGLIKEEGFAGLRDGLTLIKELHVRFWDTVFPIIEEEGGEKDFSFRAGPLEWLNEDKNLPFGIRGIPLVRSPEGEGYSLADWKEAQWIENEGRKDPKIKTEAIAEKKITVEQFNQAVQSTPLPHCLAILLQIQQSYEGYTQLQQVLLEKFGESNDDRPSIDNIRKVLEESQMVVEDIVKGKGGATVDIPGGPAGEKAAGTPQRGTGGGIHPHDRLDALARLAAVAEFFQQTEPHSPIGPLVKRAAKWGEIPLKDWLEEVIPNKEAVGKVLETLGLVEKKPQQ